MSGFGGKFRPADLTLGTSGISQIRHAVRIFRCCPIVT